MIELVGKFVSAHNETLVSLKRLRAFAAEQRKMIRAIAADLAQDKLARWFAPDLAKHTLALAHNLGSSLPGSILTTRDLSKDVAAWAAYELLRQLSRNRPNSTAEGRFHSIASLLYETPSGTRGSNMKRACDRVKREARQGMQPFRAVLDALTSRSGE